MKITKTDLVELISGTFDAEFSEHPIDPHEVVEKTITWLEKLDLLKELSPPPSEKPNP